jgi:hypothetical protein
MKNVTCPEFPAPPHFAMNPLDIAEAAFRLPKCFPSRQALLHQLVRAFANVMADLVVCFVRIAHAPSASITTLLTAVM